MRTSKILKPLSSQRSAVSTVVGGLSNRDIVCMWGEEPNGKTSTYYSICAPLSLGLENRHVDTLPWTGDKTQVVICEGIEPPMLTSMITIDKIKRQVLEMFGEPYNTRPLDMHRRFIKLLLALEQRQIIPVLATDSVELLPKRAFSVYKHFNQLHLGSRPIGFGILLSGNFAQRKLPLNFWQHVTEVQVGKPTAGQVKEYIMELCPERVQLFTEEAIRKIEQCRSTLDMYNIITRSVAYWSRSSREKTIDAQLVRIVIQKHEENRQRRAA